MFVYYLCVAEFYVWRMSMVAVVVSLPLLMMFSFMVPLSFAGCLFVAHVLHIIIRCFRQHKKSFFKNWLLGKYQFTFFVRADYVQKTSNCVLTKNNFYEKPIVFSIFMVLKSGHL